jgi:hypothetical protein
MKKIGVIAIVAILMWSCGHGAKRGYQNENKSLHHMKLQEEMNKLPEDILKKIELDYKTSESQNYVVKNLLELFSMDLKDINIGDIKIEVYQLIRSILVIADGDIAEFNRILEWNNSFYSDPRDIIMDAMMRTNYEINYGLNPFKLDGR